MVTNTVAADKVDEVGPFFSVVIPTRDRAELLSRALASVEAQRFRDVEVLVVDDGSKPACANACGALVKACRIPAEYLHLGSYRRGRGPAYVRNVGAWRARGQYLAFLDDDDEWSDAAYLEKAHAALRAGAADILFANQVAIEASSGESKPLWLHRLAERMRQAGKVQREGCYALTVANLAAFSGFCHLNTTVVRRDLFNSIGGFDEFLLYEEDLEFYLRAVDSAQGILLLPDTVSRHYTASGEARDSVSQGLRRIERLISRRQLLSKSLLKLHSAALKRQCRKRLSHVNRDLARLMVDRGDSGLAFNFAAEAVVNGATLRWFLFTLLLAGRALSDALVGRRE
ncbi:glycosyltransferase family 2 protein [Parahaliea mediterranea]|uniref:glycosyltransferase family 2 protein n=1 Tax=Parahaliea mediterranea TaxID=651086 RepID=UPI0013006AFB|nr:glycosyltransferase family A protein [Parahaliea mediterranea]